MSTVYLSRRNLLTLLSKLDRKAKGEDTFCTIIKGDTTHKKYPCSEITEVIAVEDNDYYAERAAGPVVPQDMPK